MSWIDRISGALGHCAAWLFVATGLMLVWEVIARYAFNAPTIWAAELSQLLLIWATFLGAAMLLRDQRHIAITLLTSHFGTRSQQVSHVLSLLFIMLFSLWLAWHGFDIAFDSLQRGRSTGTMMNLPNWLTEAAIPLGFSLLALQALQSLITAITHPRPNDEASH